MRARGSWDPGRVAYREICRNVRDIERTRCGYVERVYVDVETFDAICRWAKLEPSECAWLLVRGRPRDFCIWPDYSEVNGLRSLV